MIFIKNRKILNITLAVVSVLVLGIVVAYAALSTVLDVSFTGITQNALTWDVGFREGTVTAEVAGTSDTGRSCGAATVTTNKVSVQATTLSKPGDKCTYPLVIENNGDIAATLSSITPKTPNGINCGTASEANMVCGNITYKLTKARNGEELIEKDTVLAASGDPYNVYLVASYTGEGINSSAVTQSGAEFELNYSQK